MNKLIALSTGLFLAAFAICILSTGCSKVTPDQANNELNPFSLAPYECNITGSINITKLSKLDIVKKEIEANKNTALIKELNEAGMGWGNISNLYFAISPSAEIQSNIPSPDAVILFESKSKMDIIKLMFIVENEIKQKITSEKIGAQTVYIIPQDDNHEVYVSELKDNLVAIGSKDIIIKTIDLYNGKGKSVLDNTELMKFTNNTKQDNMLWIGGVIDQKLLNSLGVPTSTVNLKGGLITGDYLNDTITIGGNIECASNEEAQKILLPLQMLTAMLASNPETGIKPEDISLKVNNNELNIKVSIAKQALELLANQQMQNLPTTGSPKGKVQLDSIVPSSAVNSAEEVLVVEEVTSGSTLKPTEAAKPAATVKKAEEVKPNEGIDSLKSDKVVLDQ